MMRARVLLTVAAILGSLCLCSGAEADVTIGELAPQTPIHLCNLGPTDAIQLATSGAGSYVVPEPGTLTSWSTSAAPGLGQTLSLKVYRPVSGTTYSVLAQDGPQSLAPSVVNTFPIDIPVQTGDVIGLNDGNAGIANDACRFDTASPGDLVSGLLGTAPDGAQLNFEAIDTRAELRLNVAANLVPSAPAVETPGTPTSGGAPSSGGAPTSGPPPAPAPSCVVPRLGAKTLAAAKKALKKADCRLGRVTKLNGAKPKSGLVVSQNPQSGKKLAGGAKVAVKLAPPKTQ